MSAARFRPNIFDNFYLGPQSTRRPVDQIVHRVFPFNTQFVIGFARGYLFRKCNSRFPSAPTSHKQILTDRNARACVLAGPGRAGMHDQIENENKNSSRKCRRINSQRRQKRNFLCLFSVHRSMHNNPFHLQQRFDTFHSHSQGSR